MSMPGTSTPLDQDARSTAVHADAPNSPISSNIFDHYTGFDVGNSSTLAAIPSFAHLRQNSNHSLFSHRSTRSSDLQHDLSERSSQHEAYAASGRPKVRHSPSQSSSSSSLRNTFAMLKAGIYPPGLQRQWPTRDDSSDASHYDENEETEGFGIDGIGPFSAASSQMKHGKQEEETDEVYSNAHDAPAVPARNSSVFVNEDIERYSQIDLSDEPSKTATSDMEQTYNARNDFMLETPRMSRRPLSVESDDKIAPAAAAAATVTERGAETFPKVEDSEDSMAAQAAAEVSDPDRPRTLKEARALAKERAKLRQRAREATDATITGPSSDSPATASANLAAKTSSSPEKGVVSESDREGIELGNGSEPPTVQHAEYRKHSRQRAMPITPEKEEGHSQSLAEEREGAAMQHTRSASSAAMEDLQSAVGAALAELSFVSTASSGTEMAGPLASKEFDVPFSPPSGPLLKGELDTDSSAPSAASFDSAQESLQGSRPTSAVAIPSTPAGPSILDGTVATPTVRGDFTPVVSTQESESPTRFVPHTLRTQQRATAPNKIARLDIYGRTIPWPPAFNPTAIIEQRRLAPWERARSYAHYCNDLVSTASGLMVWMEMVQRPAQRIAAVDPSTPRKTHVRGEGTEHSGYAASVRSDATFPIRGDGGRAKELMTSMPATIDESPSNVLPTNIPYPALAQQASRGSSSSADEAFPTAPYTERDRSLGLGRPGNFLSSLGRKTSVRRTPGSGSITALSSFVPGSSTAPSIPARGAMRAKGKTISNPIAITSSPSLQTIKSTPDPQSTSDNHSSPSQGTLASRGRMPSSPTHASTPSARTPMGPRAPVGTNPNLPFPSSSSGRRESATSIGGSDKAATGIPTTDYAQTPVSPPLGTVKSSLSYNSVREKKSPRGTFAALQPPSIPGRRSSEYNKRSASSSRRGSQHASAEPTPAEEEALDKLADVLPDAERTVLLEYLRKAGGNDLVAIGDYLQAQSTAKGKQLLR